MNLNEQSISAINELKCLSNTEITKYEINDWLLKHQSLFVSIESNPESYNNQMLFYNCYSNLFDLYKVIEMEEETAKALREFKELNVNNEMGLLKWLVDFEYLNINFISLSGKTITEESIAMERGQIMKGLDVFFKIEKIQNCIKFDTVFNKYYIPIMRIYNTLSEEESEKVIPFDDNYDEILSLKHHLKKKGICF
jgi:hypothetical protein